MGTAAAQHRSHFARAAVHAARFVKISRVSDAIATEFPGGVIGLAGAIEVVCGFMLALGIYTRWVAFIISGEMAVAFFIVRQRLSISFFPLRSSGQLEAIYSIFFFTFFLIGGGAWSVDKLRRSPRP